MRHTVTSHRGFSILELLIYIAILSIVVIVLSAALISFVRAKARVEAIVEVDEALRFISEQVTRDIEGAQAISLPAIGSGTSTLAFTHASSAAMYTLTNGVLYRTFGTTTETLSSERVVISSLIFERTENYEAQLPATSTGIRWVVHAQHRFIAPEYAYDGSRQGSAEVRNPVTP
jgi:type II secretory pathway pseudopilin PulG